MASDYSERLREEVVEELTMELHEEAEFNSAKLAIKVMDAIRKVKKARCYQHTSYTEKEIEKDLYENYYSVVKDLALYYWNKIGAEFENSHIENGVSRTYIKEAEILRDVAPFVKIF